MRRQIHLGATSIIAVHHFFIQSSFAAVKTSTTPLSIPPSQYWDGDDGAWSTFQIQIGSPPQPVRLLPGTSATTATSIWAVIPQGCDDTNPNLPNCANRRGDLFRSNTSTTWSTQGLANSEAGAIFTADTYEESILGLGVDASWGFDTVTLGLPGSGLPTLQSQLIAGIATNDFFIGSLPLSPIPTNFSTFNEPVTSLLSNLRNQSLIPSLTWAYTAGSYSNNTFGSLTLGGYDTTRFEANNVTFAFQADISRDLVVGLQSITYNTRGSSPVLSQSINIFIDSMVSDIWLPTDVCNAFAQQFNLTYNEQGNLYTIQDSARQALLAENPIFTFTIGQPSSGLPSGETVDIAIPYAAFDLNLTAPILGANETARYFPLKQAQNSTQYTLGRAFLQQAYIIADYDRRNFSVSQALFPPTTVNQNIAAIHPPGADSDSKNGSSSLSGGAIAGIILGVLLGIAVVLVGVLIWLRRRRSSMKAAAALKLDEPEPSADNKEPGLALEEAEGNAIHEADGDNGKRAAELSGSGDPYMAKKGASEMHSDSKLPLELGSEQVVHEMGAPMFAHEMAANEDPVELP